MSDSSTSGLSFTGLEEALRSGGVAGLFERLIESLRAEKKYPQLFEAKLMRRRHELGLPLEGGDSIRDLPEELQRTVEDFYVETCREIGGLFLAEDDIPGAWPYFRAIDEPADVKAAIDAWSPPEDDESAEEEYDPDTYDDSAISQCDQIVDIAFQQGANPVRGYELILSQYGSCRGITIFEHQFPYSGEVKQECAKRLVRHLYAELLGSLRYDLERRGVELSDDATVGGLVEKHPELFDESGYHIDISHLQAVVRATLAVGSSDELTMGLDLCEYGRRLARDFQNADPPPFEDFYNDYRILIRALLGQGMDGAIRYFRTKAERASVDEYGRHVPGEILVFLLDRAGKADEAIDVHLEYLKDVQNLTGWAPTLPQLAARSGSYDRLRDLAREKQDVLQFTAALVHSQPAERS